MHSDEQTDPDSGPLDHYLGEKGRAYFAWQSEPGLRTGLYNLHLWAPHIAPTDDVLDFGCGGGFLLKLLGTTGRRVGVEINPAAQEKARELGIEVYETIEQVPGTFDKVISSHALEHVSHPRATLIDLRGKLRNEKSRMVLLLPINDWRNVTDRTFHPGDENMHLHTWTPQVLGNLLVSSGLAVEDIRIVQHAWPPHSERLWNLSPQLFHAAAYLYSGWNKQRQLLAIARRAK